MNGAVVGVYCGLCGGFEGGYYGRAGEDVAVRYFGPFGYAEGTRCVLFLNGAWAFVRQVHALLNYLNSKKARVEKRL